MPSDRAVTGVEIGAAQDTEIGRSRQIEICRFKMHRYFDVYKQVQK